MEVKQVTRLFSKGPLHHQFQAPQFASLMALNSYYTWFLNLGFFSFFLWVFHQSVVFLKISAIAFHTILILVLSKSQDLFSFPELGHHPSPESFLPALIYFWFLALLACTHHFMDRIFSLSDAAFEHEMQLSFYNRIVFFLTSTISSAFIVLVTILIDSISSWGNLPIWLASSPFAVHAILFYV